MKIPKTEIRINALKGKNERAQSIVVCNKNYVLFNPIDTESVQRAISWKIDLGNNVDLNVV